MWLVLKILTDEYMFDIANKVTEFRSIIFVVGENDFTEKVWHDFYANLGMRRDITTDDNSTSDEERERGERWDKEGI